MIPRRKIFIDRVDVSEWFKEIASNGFSKQISVKEFESRFAKYLGSKFALATASGRDALLLSLKALGIKKGDEIIVPAFTLGELVSILKKEGYSPITADIDEASFNIDVNSIKQKIGSKTKAILATHLFGAPCDIKSICTLAKENGIFVIEDCAHTLGAVVDGKKAGTFGDVSFFSFEVNKPVSTYGGGMISTCSKQIAQAIKSELVKRSSDKYPIFKKTLFTWIEELLIRSPFYSIIARVLFSEKISSSFERFYRSSHDRQRSLALFTEYQAKIGLTRLNRIERRNKLLNKRWDQLAEKMPRGIVPQKRDKFGSPSFYNFVATIQISPAKFRKVAAKLGADIGIGSEIMDNCAAILNSEGCNVAKKVSESTILIPLYENLSEKEFSRLISVLSKTIHLSKHEHY